MTLDDRISVFSRDNFSCVHCGRSQLNEEVRLHVEHLIHGHMGDKIVLENLVTVCSECVRRSTAR